MASDLSIRTSDKSSSINRLEFSENEKESIAEVSSKLFGQIEKYFATIGGVPINESRGILNLTGSMYKSFFSVSMRPSLFDQHGFPPLNNMLKKHLCELLSTNYYMHELPLFLSASIHLMQKLKGLAKENLRCPVKEMSDNCSQFIFALLLHMDAKADVEKKILSSDPAASSCLMALKSPNVSFSPKDFVEAMHSLAAEVGKMKNSATKKEVLIHIELLTVLTEAKGFDETLYFTELKSFKECVIEPSSVAQLLPVISVLHNMLENLRYILVANDHLDVHRRPLSVLDASISEFAKTKPDDVRRDNLLKIIFKAYIDHCLVSAPLLHHFLQYKQIQLHSKTLDPKLIANAYAHESACKQFIYVFEKVGEFLGLYHENKTCHLLARISSMFIHFYCVNRIEIQYEFKPALQNLSDILHELHQISLFHISDNQYQKVMKDYLDVYDLSHLFEDIEEKFRDAFYNCPDTDVYSLFEQSTINQEIKYQKSMKFFSLIPSVLCFFRFKLFNFADVKSVDSKLKIVYENLIFFVNHLDAEKKTIELQQVIRDCLTDALGKLIVEYLLYHDMSGLYSDTYEDADDLNKFPSILLQLIFFDIPGLDQPVADDLEEDIKFFQRDEETKIPPLVEPLQTLSSPVGQIPPSQDIVEERETLALQTDKVVKATEKLLKRPENPEAKKTVASRPSYEDFRRAKKYRQMKKLIEMFEVSQLRTKGSHESYGGDNVPFTVLPRHSKDLKIGMRRAIWKQISQSFV